MKNNGPNVLIIALILLYKFGIIVLTCFMVIKYGKIWAWLFLALLLSPSYSYNDKE